MQLPIFFQKEIPDVSSFTLSEESSRHIAQVLRMKESELIQLTNGAGTIITAEITNAHKNHTEVKVLERTEVTAPKKKIAIAISFIKSNGNWHYRDNPNPL